MRKPITFVLSDENVENSYGFKVRHTGIKMERFKANPVMLDSHWNSNRYVLGRWSNTRFEGTQMKAETDFDYEDKNIEDIIGKVERNFIKGASLGLIFDPTFLAYDANGELWLEQSEQMEASICPVPSNGNSISLYNAKGELLTEKEVKELCLSAQNNNATKINTTDKNQNKMEKIILSATALVALGLAVAPENTSDLSVAVENLAAKLTKANADLASEKTAKEALQTQLTAQKESQAKIMLSEAKLAGKITAEEETEMLKDAIANPEGTAKLLAKIPAKASLAGMVSNSGAGEGKVKTMDDFEKLTDEAKLAFKNDSPEAYKALFK